jgi:hypothetical protein
VAEPQPVVNNSAAKLLATQRSGLCLDELSTELNKLVLAVRDTGKGGSVAVRFTVKPAPKGTGAVIITDDVSATIPEEDKTPSFWFTTADGGLQRTDPRQTEMKLNAIK